MLREQVPSLRGRGFALRTAFPNRLYEDHAESLAAAGLVPNAVMMVRCHELCETSGSGCFLSGTGFSQPYMAAISQLDVQSSLNLLSRQKRQMFSTLCELSGSECSLGCSEPPTLFLQSSSLASSVSADSCTFCCG